MGDQDPVYAAGIWDVRPGNEQAFIEVWKEFSAWTALHQKGSGYGNLLQDLDNPSRFISFGPWDSLESVQTWRRQPEFRKAIARFMDLCDQVTPGTFRLVAGEGGGEKFWIPGPAGRPGPEGDGAGPGGRGPSGPDRDRPGGKGAPPDQIPGPGPRQT
jgi:heme-degrading monooxygenase HmoA